jgi:hypothetical protein
VTAETCEYLVSYGCSGDFGRFRSARPLPARRGDRAVVRTARGLELATLLCAAEPGHAHFLPNTTVGELLRLATAQDEELALQIEGRCAALFADGRRLAAELDMPLEVVDAELLFDGEHAVLHHLPWGEFDERDLVSALVRRHDVSVALHSLRLPAEDDHEEGCGREGCGRGGCGSSGGCGTCGSGGCGSGGLKEYFAELRKKMQEQNAGRTPLL